MEAVSILQARIAELEAENEQLKQKQLEVDKAKELYLKIFEHFPALIWRSGLDMNCNYFNHTWLEFTGRTMEQEVGNGWAEGVHPDDFDFCLNTYVNAFQKREAFLMEYRLKDKHGEYRWLYDYGRPFYDLDETFLGYIGSCYDFTESKNNELKLVELNATKNKFLSVLAHDLRSPYATLIGYSSLMVESLKNDDHEHIETIANKINEISNHSLIFLDDLLLWGKGLSDGVSIQKKELNCVTLCDELIQESKEISTKKNIHIQINKENPLLINADTNMFKTIVRNILSNALKFTNTGGEIRIDFKTTEKFFQLIISDNGVGMTNEVVATILNNESRTSTRGTANEIGTGFGISICNQLIELHQGYIQVESKVGEGSTFILNFPIN